MRKYKKPISTSELNNKINNEKYKIEINQEGYYLLDACEKNHERIIKYLVEYGADVSQKNSDNDTPLTIACKKGNVNIIKYLMEHGADESFKMNILLFGL